MNHSLSSALGLCKRAGKMVEGEENVLKAIRSRAAFLVIVTTDASNQTAKQYTDKCGSYQVPLKRWFTRTELGSAIGKPERVAVAIIDKGFARMIEEKANLKTEVENIE